MDTAFLVGMGVMGVFFLAAILSGLFVVEQQQQGVIERFGKFARTVQPGLNFKIPFIETVYKLNMQVTQLDVDVETKTKDNVFVTLRVSVQFVISDAFKALYKLNNYKAQISSYVFDVVRAEVPKLALDDVFAKKDDVATAIKGELADAMDDFGYSIVKALITDVDPDATVKAAMNEINAATRMRAAATEKAEAEKILQVKRAEAEAEAKLLQGQGIANQRKAIAHGLKESVEDLKAAGTESSEAMSILLLTQYFDTLRSLAGQGTHTILMNHSPGALGDLQTQLMTALQTANLPTASKTGTTGEEH